MANTPSPSKRYPENGAQQQPMNSTTFPIRPSYNPRLVITPETLGINVLSAINREHQQVPQQQQQQPEAPLVDVKSYYERHCPKPRVGQFSDLTQDSKTSFHSTHSNTPRTSFISLKSENVSQNTNKFPTSPTSPNNSPNPQWTIDSPNNNYNTTPLQSPTQSAIYNSCVNPFSPSACGTLQNRKSSGDLPANDAPYISSGYGLQCSSLTEIYNACTDKQQLPSPGSDACDSALLNYKTLNKIYSDRIEDIDANVWGDKDLKIVTYQEWIEMLTKINENFITNMEELEREVAERLELVQRKVNSNCRHSQGNELMKSRKDIDTLLKYIRNARTYNTWDLQGLTFETISPAQVLDMGELYVEGNGDSRKNSNDAEQMQRNQVYANMKALVHEVAEKHDEMRELRRQVIALEDEIQKAQQKIQLKDDVIKELRNDLKASNQKLLINSPVDPGLTMAPINFDTPRSGNTQITDTPMYQEDNGSHFDSLSNIEHEEQQQIKVLHDEIHQFFEMNNEFNKQKMEAHRKSLMDIFQKSINLTKESERAAHRKLDFIRRQLIDLESDSVEAPNDSDSGFLSKSENNQDAKILESVRKRFRKLNETNVELRKRLQKLELENNELSNSLQSEKSFFQQNSQTLKEVANLLSEMKGEQFSYTDIYNKGANDTNPFCEAIMDMKKSYEEREKQLLTAVGLRNKQVAELSHSLIENEKDFSDERALNCNPILEDINSTPPSSALTPTTTQILESTTSTSPAASLESQTLSTSSLAAAAQQLVNASPFLQQDLEEK